MKNEKNYRIHLLFYLKLFLLTLIIASCSNPKEVIINSETNEKVIGFDRSCKYRIGRTRKSDLGQELLKQLESDSLFLIFNYASDLRESETLLAGQPAGKYKVRSGLKPGDSVEKAVSIYGKPVATDLEYWRDEEHRIIWSFPGLFYKNMMIVVDTSNNTVMGISVGRQFEIDRKYRKKSYWFKN